MIRIAPAKSRDWGRAILNELPYVESAWAALLWALGGATMLAKHMLLSRAQSIVPSGALFARNVSLRKVALAASVVYVLGALLFFAAPPFRQGLRVSLIPWKALLHLAGEGGQAQINAISKRAEARRDGDGLVFAAARVSSARESARLADEAVRLNRRLVWAYAIVAVRHPEIPEIRQWMPVLERWQPGNALFPLIIAESIPRDDGIPNSSPAEGDNASTPGTAWQQAMAAAFTSPKFEDYLDRLQAVDQRVAQKYGFNNPEELWEGEQGGLPETYFSDARRYAISLLDSGDRLDARGDWRGAEANYWCVARFGQVMDSQAHADYEHWAGGTLQWMAYQRLETVAVSRGDTGEAALLAYLAKKFDPKMGEAAIALRDSVFGDYVAKRNAFVLQLSALMMLVFSGLLIGAAAVPFITSRAHGRPERKKRGTIVFVTLTSAVGLLLSSATVYLTYRPYWYILQGDLLKGSARRSSGLRTFLAAIRTLPGFDRRIIATLPVYFWASVILAAIAALTLIFLRHFRDPPRLPEAQPNSHV
ncbi:MAG TPA: hypothetical protein VMI06_15580 [Terriglobia bacterium]|nr:hypothetical protein [Terriglobia bacterium]